MNINVRDFLGASYNHGYIIIINNKELNEVLWEGKYETIENQIPSYIAKADVVKWGIQDNGIVIYINHAKLNEEDFYESFYDEK